MEERPLSDRLAALGHPTRLALYERLVEAGAAGIGPVALGALTGVARTLVSYHLKPLVAAGLVVSERRGRDVNHRVELEALERMSLDLLALVPRPGRQSPASRSRGDPDASRSDP